MFNRNKSKKEDFENDLNKFETIIKEAVHKDAKPNKDFEEALKIKLKEQLFTKEINEKRPKNWSWLILYIKQKPLQTFSLGLSLALLLIVSEVLVMPSLNKQTNLAQNYASDFSSISYHLAADYNDERSLDLYFNKLANLFVREAKANFIPVDQNINFEFTFPLAKILDIKNNFKIEPAIEGEVAFDGENITFIHDKNFNFNTKYTITIQAGLNLGNGETTQADITYEFSTRPAAEYGYHYFGSSIIYTLNYYDSVYQLPFTTSGLENIDIKLYQANIEDLILNKSEEINLIKNKKFNIQNLKLLKEWSTNTKDIKVDNERYLLELPLENTGIYYLSINNNNDIWNIPVVLSKHSLINKKAGNTNLTWAANIKSSRSAAEMQLKYYNLKTNSFTQGITDNNGLHQFTSLKNETFHLIVGQINDDITVNWIADIYRNNKQTTTETAYIYTDKTNYKPGDIIKINALIKVDNDVVYSDTDIQTVTLKIISQNNQRVIINKELSVSNGNITDEIQTSEYLPEGEYEITILNENNVISRANLNINNNKKTNFEFNINPEQQRYLEKEEIAFNLSAEYLFKQPLANKEVNYEISLKNYNLNWEQTFNENFLNKDFINNLAGEVIENNKIKLDQNGQATIKFTPDLSDKKFSNLFIYSISASVNNDANQIQTNTNYVLIFKHPYLLNISADNLSTEINEDLNKTITINDIYGNPLPNKEIDIVIIKAEDEKSKTWLKGDKEIYSDILTSNEQGEVILKYKITEPGKYFLNASITDINNNIYSTQKSIWVYGEYLKASALDMLAYQSSRMTVEIDKDQYQIGDIIKLKLSLPRDEGDILITTSRGKIYDTFIEKVTSREMTIAIPVKKEYLPNIFINIDIMHDINYLSHSINVDIDKTSQELNIEIKPSQTTALPGQEITYSLFTTDSQGQPVSADIAFAVSDKATYKNPTNINNYFYDNRSTNINSAHSFYNPIQNFDQNGCFTSEMRITMADDTFKAIKDIEIGDIIKTKTAPNTNTTTPVTVIDKYESIIDEYLIINGKLELTPVHLIYLNNKWQPAADAKIGDYIMHTDNQLEKIYSVEKIEAQTKVYNLKIDNLNTFIVADIYIHQNKINTSTNSIQPSNGLWQTTITTDELGQAIIKMPLPKQLSTYIITASGISKTLIGQTTTEITTSQPIITRAHLPAFANIGDEVILRATVANYSEQTEIIKVAMNSPNLQIKTNQEFEYEINPGEAKELKWTVYIPEIKQAEINLVTQYGTIEEIQNLNLPITAPGFKYQQNFIGYNSNDFIINPVDTDTYNDFNYLSIQVTNYQTQQTLDILNNIIEQPTGNVEQIITALGTNLVAIEVHDNLSISIDEINYNINYSLQKLAEYQHEDYGWGWYKNDASNVWLTGYVIEYLMKAKEAGYKQADELLQKAWPYATTIANNNDNQDLQIFFIYLATKGKNLFNYKTPEYSATINSLNNLRTEMTLTSQAYLARSFYYDSAVANKEFITTIINELNNKSISNNNIRYWEDITNYKTLTSQSFTNAIILQTLLETKQTQEVQKIINWLLSNKTGTYWENSRATNEVMQAIIQNAQIQNYFQPNYQYSVYINNQLMQTAWINSINGFDKPLQLELNQFNLPLHVKIIKTGSGFMEYNITLEQALKQQANINTENSFKINREYQDIAGNPVNEFQAGDLVKSIIYIESELEQANDIIVKDWLPTGFEIIAPDASVENPVLKINYNQTINSINYTIPTLNSNKTSLTTIIQATTPGILAAPPAQLNMLIYPDNYAISNISTLHIK